MAKVLVACEFSGTVRDAFIAAGHMAVSCDLLPSEKPGPHLQMDVRALLRLPWDLVIAHPPCTFLTKARGKLDLAGMEEGIAFFMECLNANAPRVCVENPTPFLKVQEILGKPSCIVEPFHFGDPWRKRTLLWTRGLPPLMPEMDNPNPKAWIVKRTGGWRNRSRFFPGMARAMAEQWGRILVE